MSIGRQHKLVEMYNILAARQTETVSPVVEDRLVLGLTAARLFSLFSFHYLEEIKCQK